jgi:hypothetical protein
MITRLITESFSTFHRVTTAASKEENAIVKREIKEVNRHCVFDIASSVRWSFGLPMIQRIINTTVHSGIGIAPAQLVFHPPARTNAFVAELFRMQARMLETALVVQLA